MRLVKKGQGVAVTLISGGRIDGKLVSSIRSNTTVIGLQGRFEEDKDSLMRFGDHMSLLDGNCALSIAAVRHISWQ